jgi:hypothetical protein
MTEQPSQEFVYARASINLPGLPLGRVALVDPNEPYVAESLARGYLVREGTTDPDDTQDEQ